MEANNQLIEFVVDFIHNWSLADLSITGFVSMVMVGALFELLIIYAFMSIPLYFVHRNDKRDRVVSDLPLFLFGLNGLYVTDQMIRIHYDLTERQFRKMASYVQPILDCHNRYAVYGVPFAGKDEVED